MPREIFDRQIRQLQDEVLLLGSMVEQFTLSAVDAFKRREPAVARKLYVTDSLINEKRYAIENAIIILMATQQPMAHDLRLMAAMLEVITELERMGDYAKGICKVTVKLDKSELDIPIKEFSRMAELAVSMLHRALGAFISENVNLATYIPNEDDEVDDLYNTIYRKIVDNMMANPKIIDNANLLLWVAHNLERLADRVINICVRVVFISTGELYEIDSTDDEMDSQ